MAVAAEWAKLPSRWIIRDKGLYEFSVAETGRNIAALKVYIAITLFSNFAPNPQFKNAGFSCVTYDDLSELTGLSRAMVSQGIGCLEDRQLLRAHRSNGGNVYELLDYSEPPGWAKLPKRHILVRQLPSVLAHLQNRGRLALESLKLYLLIAAFRDSKSDLTLISYEKIAEYTNIPRPHIRKAIDSLINHDLVKFVRDQDPLEEVNNRLNPANKYRLIGLSEFARRPAGQPLSKKVIAI